jgi:hypothetical protein
MFSMTGHCALENVSVFELQSIQRIDYNLALQLFESIWKWPMQFGYSNFKIVTKMTISNNWL